MEGIKRKELAMILGDDLIGLVSHKFDNNELNCYIVKLNMFPISISFERHYDDDVLEFKIILLQKYTIGLYVSK